MEDYAKYIDEPVKEEPVKESGPVSLSGEDAVSFINRFSGKNNDGESKSTICYQSYDLSTNDPEKEKVYQIIDASVQISKNKHYNDLYTVDFIFKSSDDTELKLFWLRLQKYLKNQSEHPDKDYIFYIQLLEKASVTQQTEHNDNLLICNMINPILFYLTREVPDQKIHDQNVKGEMIGGNIIRMIIGNQNLTFNIISDIDTNEIKREVQRQIDEAAFYESNYQ